MKEERILFALSDIRDSYITEAASGMYRRKRYTGLKWAAAAACFCLIAALTLPRFLPAFVDESFNPPDVGMAEPKDNLGAEAAIAYGATSDRYETLSELLDYLSEHDNHDNKSADALGGGGIPSQERGTSETESVELIENTGVAVSMNGEFVFHIGEDAVYVTHLIGKSTESVGKIDRQAAAVFTCNNNLLIVSEYESGGDELDREMSVRVEIYDISDPEIPVLTEEYCQLGQMTACWMIGADLYVVTSDGVCACGWSRLHDPSGYYPSLTHQGEIVPWGEEDISILGEPMRAEYCAVTVINGNTRNVVQKKALYGNILKLFYGDDWIAVSVGGETETVRENPVLYTFDSSLAFTGKLSLANRMHVPEQNELIDYVPQDGTYLGITSVTKTDGMYRLLGTCSVRNGEDTSGFFLAAAAEMQGGEVEVQLLSGEDYPFGSYTEILWEKERAIACVGVMNNAFTAEMEQETRFIFVAFDGLSIHFYENELRADYLDTRVGSTYGNPLDAFRSLIPMGVGIYVRYTARDEGPGGFELFDFSDNRSPSRLTAEETSLADGNAFDFVWLVYSDSSFGTLKLSLGPEDYFRDVSLCWFVFSVDPENEQPILLQREVPLSLTAETFFADTVGFTVFQAGKNVYYTARTMETANYLEEFQE